MRLTVRDFNRLFLFAIAIAFLVGFGCSSCSTAQTPSNGLEFSDPYAPSTGFVARAVVVCAQLGVKVPTCTS